MTAVRLFVLAAAAIGAESPPPPAPPKTIEVFVALADNKSQGIVPVPAAIGNGDDPDRNLYWGTADGLKGFFDRSARWKLVAKDDAPGSGDVLRTRTYRHASGKVVLRASAYRGSAIRKCIGDFESAVARGAGDLVAYIGHDGLMDFELPAPARSKDRAKVPDCAVLCCKSERYFKARLEAAGGRPILLTTQLMYPGSFLLAAAAESWLEGPDLGRIRDGAAAAYAENQKISKKAAARIFAELRDAAPRPADAAPAGTPGRSPGKPPGNEG